MHEQRRLQGQVQASKGLKEHNVRTCVVESSQNCMESSYDDCSESAVNFAGSLHLEPAVKHSPLLLNGCCA